MDIRPADPPDLSAIAALVHDAYSPWLARIGQRPGPMDDDYAAHIAHRHARVAIDGRQIVGLLVLIPKSDHMLLDNLAIAPGHQGRGLGRKLVALAEAETRTAELRLIRLYTHQKMVSNIGLYERLGFVVTHRAVEHGLPRVFMAKRLD